MATAPALPPAYPCTGVVPRRHPDESDLGEGLAYIYNEFISYDQMTHARRLYKGEWMIIASKMIKHHYIFKNGIVITWGAKKIRVKREFEEAMLKIAKEVAELLEQIGGFAYKQYKIPSRFNPNVKFRYPKLLPFGTYRIRQHWKKGFGIVYDVIAATSTVAGMVASDFTKAKVYMCPEYLPEIDGTLSSPVSTLFKELETTGGFVEDARDASYESAHPTLFTQQLPNANNAPPQETLYGDADMIQQHEQRQKETNDRAADALSRQVSSGRNLTYTPSVNAATKTVSYRRRGGPPASSVSLPNGQAMANAPLAQGRNDALLWEEHKERVIGSVLGVPRNLLMAEISAQNASGISTAITLLNNAVQELRDQVIEAMENMLYEIYQKQELQELFEEALSAKDDEKRLREIEKEIESDRRYHVEFPFTTIAPTDDILKIAAQGVWSRQRVAELLVTSLGFRADTVELQKPEDFPDVIPELAKIREEGKLRKRDLELQGEQQKEQAEISAKAKKQKPSGSSK